MSWIYLDGIELRAPIGVGEEERKQGNIIRVNLGIHYDFSKAAVSDNIEDTVDYGALYHLVYNGLQEPTHLLEAVAHRICMSILDHFPQIEEVKIELSKLEPPIDGICERARIVLTKSKT